MMVVRALAAPAVASIALLAAGCGGSKTPAVADSGTTTSGSAAVHGALAYSQCMRTHGVGDFPDPDSSGTIDLKSVHPGPGSDLDPTNARFQAAAGACRSLQPPGFLTEHKPDQAQVAQAVKWAQCMRAHGIVGFPDPDSSGRISIGSLRSAGFDPHSPQGQSAMKACEQYEPASIHIASG